MRTLTNPATGQTVEAGDLRTFDQIAPLIDAAADGFRRWSGRTVAERAGAIAALGGVLRAHRDELAGAFAAEMGKPVSQGLAEVDKSVGCCEWVAGHGPAFLQDEQRAIEPDRPGGARCVRYRPLGVILAVMPWNFPLWQVIRFAAPALLTGNVALLKHAPNVPRSADLITRCFHEAAMGGGVFVNVDCGVDAVEPIIAHSAVAAATLTGSTRAGSSLAALCGKYVKPVVLELGGSDAFVVVPPVDIASVAKTAAAARCLNSGQSCIAAKRFIVDRSIFSRFRDAFVEAMSAMRVGDPGDPATQVGPLARRDLLDNLLRQIDAARQAGGRLLCGGDRPADTHRDGFYIRPAVVEAAPGNPAWEEETFGPVAALAASADDDDAIRLANATRYGLGASVWCDDRGRARRIASRIDAGSIFINATVRSDPRLPFGGIKASGIGRELSREGLHAFANVQTVWEEGA